VFQFLTVAIINYTTTSLRSLAEAWVARPGGGPKRFALFDVLAAVFTDSTAALEERADAKADAGTKQDQTFENIAAAYVAILMGCLAVDNPENVESLRNAMPDRSFGRVVAHLGCVLCCIVVVESRPWVWGLCGLSNLHTLTINTTPSAFPPSPVQRLHLLPTGGRGRPIGHGLSAAGNGSAEGCRHCAD
jgi:hypothetical protein